MSLLQADGLYGLEHGVDKGRYAISHSNGPYHSFSRFPVEQLFRIDLFDWEKVLIVVHEWADG